MLFDTGRWRCTSEQKWSKTLSKDAGKQIIYTEGVWVLVIMYPVSLCACHRSARKTLEFLCMYPVRTKRGTRTRGGDRNFHSQESMKRTANALLYALVIVPKVESSYLRSKARDFQDHFLALGVRSAVSLGSHCLKLKLSFKATSQGLANSRRILFRCSWRRGKNKKST